MTRPEFPRSIVSFVQRGERMTVGQERAWDTYWEKMGNDVKSLPEGPLDFDSWFGRSAPVLLEIGSGMGETTSQLVAAAPELNYVAVEVYKPGLAQLLLRAEHLGGLDNLRVLRGDAVDLLTDHVGVPFEQDGWRDGEHLREWMTGLFEQELTRRGVPWLKLTEDRFATAITAVEQLMRQDVSRGSRSRA